MELFIGLMSGTSVDGIDVALVEMNAGKIKLVATYYEAYDAKLRDEIFGLCHASADEISRMAELDVALGRKFAHAVHALLRQQNVPASSIKAIGSHGQTIRHAPNGRFPYSLQIGDPNVIAADTGITTIADFRRKDIALGGQGAPLVPAFHDFLWASDKVDRAIVNIGGIANVTLLSTDRKKVLGFDTGPGNVLLDSWIKQKCKLPQDKNGLWAAQGCVNKNLLQQLLRDNYFRLPPPKSTGREYFNLAWLTKQLQNFRHPILDVNVQATLVELTASSIITAIKNYFKHAEIFICGGGAYNEFLMSRLQALGEAQNCKVSTTKTFGIEPEWVEATAFAYLAYLTLQQKTGNLASVTNAKRNAILGGIYFA